MECGDGIVYGVVALVIGVLELEFRRLRMMARVDSLTVERSMVGTGC